jgi:hypothetical protein
MTPPEGAAGGGRVGPPPGRAEVAPAERDAYDRIVERAAGRGESHFSPYLATLLHTPSFGAVISDLGRVTRTAPATGESYSRVDFELLVLALGLDVGFLWSHHLLDALAVGVRPEALDALLRGREEQLEEPERLVVEFARQVVAGTVTDASFAAVKLVRGERGAIDLTVLAGWVVATMRWHQAWGIPSATRPELEAMLEEHRRGTLVLPDMQVAARVGPAGTD